MTLPIVAAGRGCRGVVGVVNLQSASISERCDLEVLADARTAGGPAASTSNSSVDRASPSLRSRARSIQSVDGSEMVLQVVAEVPLSCAQV